MGITVLVLINGKQQIKCLFSEKGIILGILSVKIHYWWKDSLAYYCPECKGVSDSILWSW